MESGFLPSQEQERGSFDRLGMNGGLRDEELGGELGDGGDEFLYVFFVVEGVGGRADAG